YVYRHRPDIGGVVHTHSTYATAWAARGEEIPCVLTMMADEFGGPVPVGPFAVIGDDSIGRGIVETLAGSRSPAVLMQNHGPFTVGKDARAAGKAAVMVEEVARAVHIARQLGAPIPIDQQDVDALYDRDQDVYGPSDAAPGQVGARGRSLARPVRRGSSRAASASAARTCSSRPPASPGASSSRSTTPPRSPYGSCGSPCSR